MAELLEKTEIFEEDRLAREHADIRLNAIALFGRGIVGGNVRSYELELTEYIDKNYVKVVEENRAKSTEFCRKLIQTLIRRLKEGVADHKV